MTRTTETNHGLSDGCSQIGVFVGGVVGHFPDDLDVIGKNDGRVFVAQLDFGDRLVLPKRIDVDLKILVFVGQAVAVLADLTLGGVGVHQQGQVFVLAEPFFDLDALESAQGAHRSG